MQLFSGLASDSGIQVVMAMGEPSGRSETWPMSRWRIPAGIAFLRIDIPHPAMRQHAVAAQQAAIERIQGMERRPEFVEQESEYRRDAVRRKAAHGIGHQGQVQARVMARSGNSPRP